MAHQFIEADRELAEFYLSSLGVRAQSYEPSYGAIADDDASALHEETTRRRAIRRFNGTELALGRMPADERRVLRSVYAPHGWPELLACALRTRWGSGSLVGLALVSERALKAYTRRYPTQEPSPAAVLDYLRDEAGNAASARALFVGLLEDCERARVKALSVYTVIMCARMEEEDVARASAARHRESILAKDLGQKAKREHDRFERRLSRAAS